MFGLSFPGRPQETKYFFLEADRGTMPVVRTDLRRTSFLRKFLSYTTTYRDKLHHEVCDHTLEVADFMVALERSSRAYSGVRVI